MLLTKKISEIYTTIDFFKHRNKFLFIKKKLSSTGSFTPLIDFLVKAGSGIFSITTFKVYQWLLGPLKIIGLQIIEPVKITCLDFNYSNLCCLCFYVICHFLSFHGNDNVSLKVAWTRSFCDSC